MRLGLADLSRGLARVSRLDRRIWALLDFEFGCGWPIGRRRSDHRTAGGKASWRAAKKLVARPAVLAWRAANAIADHRRPKSRRIERVAADRAIVANSRDAHPQMLVMSQIPRDFANFPY